MKSTNKRLYLDFNATSPLSPSVKDWLSKGDFLYGNPSSIHFSGKQARRRIEETSEFLYSTFALSEQDFELFFHSGASEGINTLIKGRADWLWGQGQRLHFLSFDTDHSCIINTRDSLTRYGHQTSVVPVLPSGLPDWQAYEELSQKAHPALLNGTWVNNETGIITPLESINIQAQKRGVQVHIDGVQSIGKIKDWNKLNPNLHAYTFSGHKFGALKGVGFSFVRRDFQFEPLIHGGGQQRGMRSGTHNTEGIYSLRLALEDVLEQQNTDYQQQMQSRVLEVLQKEFNDVIEIVAKDNLHRAFSVFCFLLKNERANTALTMFDLADIDVSSGSACSSGALLPSRALMAMGHSEEEAKSSLRLSFPPFARNQEVEQILERLTPLLKRLR